MRKASSSTFFDRDEARVKDLGKYSALGYGRGLMKPPFSEIAERYNLINDCMSLGLHRRWKRGLVEALTSHGLKPDGKILDVASGTGDVASLFLTKIPASNIFAIDPCKEMMNEGKKKYPRLTQWYEGEAEALPFPENYFSILTCTFGIRNFKDRKLAFQEFSRTLVSGGKLGILEIHPIPQKWQFIPFQLFWKYGVPFWGRLFSRGRAYHYLRDTAAQFISPEVMIEELQPYFDVQQKKALIAGGLVTLLIANKR